MAFQKGSNKGYGARGRVEVLERFPNAVCKQDYFKGNSVSKAFMCYRVYEELGGLPVGTAWSARGAWCQAADNLAAIERQKAESD